MLINGCSLLPTTIIGTRGKDAPFFFTKSQISDIIYLFLKPTVKYRKEHFMRNISYYCTYMMNIIADKMKNKNKNTTKNAIENTTLSEIVQNAIEK